MVTGGRLAYRAGMQKLRRLFTIRTKFEVFLVVYALALGASERAVHYLADYPGVGGQMLAAACFGSVFMAGGLMLDAVEARQGLEA